MASRNWRLHGYRDLHMTMILSGWRKVAKDCGCARFTIVAEMKRRGIPTKHRDRIAALGSDVMLRLIHQSGNTLRGISALLRVCHHWMADELRRRDLWTPMSKRIMEGTSNADFEALVRDRRGINPASRHLGVCVKTVRSECKRRGVNLTGVFAESTPAAAFRKVSDSDIERAVAEAGSPFAASLTFGVSHHTMYVEIRKRGLGHLRRQHLVRTP